MSVTAVVGVNVSSSILSLQGKMIVAEVDTWVVDVVGLGGSFNVKASETNKEALVITETETKYYSVLTL